MTKNITGGKFHLPIKKDKNIQMKRLWMIGLCLCFIFSSLLAQTDDPVLFTVNNRPVTVSEFKYIYEKNNEDNAKYDRTSIMEYLDRYQTFKLKVEEARAMGLDTVKSLQQELSQYKRQLSQNYLMDNEVMGKLTEELYSRQKKDRAVHHILYRLRPNHSPKDTLQAYRKLMEFKRDIESGVVSFEDKAAALSMDNSATKNKGFIGYRTAPLPRGFYKLESAIYNMPVGKISDPVQSPLGYHLIKVSDERPARGEINVAQILVRKRLGTKPEDLKAKVNEVMAKLNAGENFEDLAEQYSEDKSTKFKGGDLGFVKINQFGQDFEDRIFAIENDGEIAEPFETKVGWHIVKRLKKKSQNPYKVEKRSLMSQVRRSERYQIAEAAVISNIMANGDYQESPIDFDKMGKAFGFDAMNGQLASLDDVSEETLFSIGGKKYSKRFFADYLMVNRPVFAREIKANKSDAENLQHVYEKFRNTNLMRYEEAHLEERYPKFKALMREFREGIILFEISKENVWDKAARDSVGLRKYYDKHKSNYKTEPKIAVQTYTLNTQSPKMVKKVRKYIGRKNPDYILSKLNKAAEVITTTVEDVDQSDVMKLYPSAKIKKKSLLQEKALDDGRTQFLAIQNIIPSKPKSFDEARGSVIADYQDALEKEWVAKLRKKYKVDVKQAVLDRLIK